MDAAAVAKWVADYERDFGRPGARRVIASSASAAEPQDDYAALFNDDVNALDRQRAVAASRAASLTDDQLYREIFGDDDGEPRPSASHPDGRPYVRVPRPAAA